MPSIYDKKRATKYDTNTGIKEDHSYLFKPLKPGALLAEVRGKQLALAAGHVSHNILFIAIASQLTIILEASNNM